MTKLHAVRGEGATETAPIAADRLIEGAPVATTRLDYERDGKSYAGEWSADICGDFECATGSPITARRSVTTRSTVL